MAQEQPAPEQPDAAAASDHARTLRMRGLPFQAEEKVRARAPAPPRDPARAREFLRLH